MARKYRAEPRPSLEGKFSREENSSASTVFPSSVKARLEGEYGRLQGPVLSGAPSTDLLCPSSDERHATLIIGHVAGDSVSFFVNPVAFPSVLRRVWRPSEFETLKMVGPCLENACGHWSTGCRLGQAAAQVATSSPDTECALRAKCRWFAEQGNSVCGTCLSITNVPFGNEAHFVRHDAKEVSA